MTSDVELAVHAYSTRLPQCDEELRPETISSQPPAGHVLQHNVLFDASIGAHMYPTTHPSAASKLGADTVRVAKLQRAATVGDAQQDACWHETVAEATATDQPASQFQVQPVHSGVPNAPVHAQDAGMQTEEPWPSRRVSAVVSTAGTEAALQELLCGSSALKMTPSQASTAHSTAGTEPALQELLSNTLCLVESIEQAPDAFGQGQPQVPQTTLQR